MKNSFNLLLFCILVFMFTIASAKIVSKPSCKTKTVINCASKCMKKVKKYPVQECIKQFKLGKKVQKCTWKKVKGCCKHKCKFGAKRCWNVCKYKKCYGKRVKVCRRKCYRNKKCYDQCKYRKLKSCWYDRLPGKLVNVCKKVWKSKTFRHCIKRCTHSSTHCRNKCALIKVPKKYTKCVKYIKRKPTVKKQCSFKKWIKKCNNFCKKKRFCANHCYWTTCDGKKIRKCKYKCHIGKKCKNVCCKHKQIKCYLKRIPAVYATKCQDYFTLNKVKKCYKKCFLKRKVIYFKSKRLVKS
jgi:hypothetical protein